MNLNFCRYRCGKTWHPGKILITKEGEWYLGMGDAFESCECNYLRIEPVPEFLKHPPKGWFICGNSGLFFEDGNAEHAMWRIRIVSGECPYIAEHTMYDIQHEQRMDDWKEKESKRLALIEGRLKSTRG